jgi:putative acetyltransferase
MQEPHINIRRTNLADASGVFAMYRRVAALPGGLARLEEEISQNYVREFIQKSMADGLSLVAVTAQDNIVGELHAYPAGLYCFSHVLTDLTIAVDPAFRKQGIAKSLFKRFFDEIESGFPHIRRVELISRESNLHAIRFYENIGFKREGRLLGRIKNLDGTLEADIPMGWTRFEG